MTLKFPMQKIRNFSATAMNADESRKVLNDSGIWKYNIEYSNELVLEVASQKASQAFKWYLQFTAGKLVLDKIMVYAL